MICIDISFAENHYLSYLLYKSNFFVFFEVMDLRSLFRNCSEMFFNIIKFIFNVFVSSLLVLHFRYVCNIAQIFNIMYSYNILEIKVSRNSNNCFIFVHLCYLEKLQNLNEHLYI